MPTNVERLNQIESEIILAKETSHDAVPLVEEVVTLLSDNSFNAPDRIDAASRLIGHVPEDSKAHKLLTLLWIDSHVQRAVTPTEKRSVDKDLREIDPASHFHEAAATAHFRIEFPRLTHVLGVTLTWLGVDNGYLSAAEQLAIRRSRRSAATPHQSDL